MSDLTSVISVFNSTVALLVSIAALAYTAKTFFLKSGARIRGFASVCSSIHCEDKYVSSIVIENMKDRSTVIFTIYLLIGRNYYLEIESFEKDPLILKPFETYTKQYDPVDFYSVSMKKINLNRLLDSKNVPNRIVLSTSDGKYEIADDLNRWSPIIDFFRNHMTAVIQPMRLEYKERSYGSNAKYIVEIKNAEGEEIVFPIYPSDFRIKRFKNFQLTKESLDSIDSLDLFLREKMNEGLLNCSEIVVHDIEKWREEAYKNYKDNIISAKYYGWFSYMVLGRLLTIFSTIRLKIINFRNKRANKKR